MHPEKRFHSKPKSKTSWDNVAGWYNQLVGEKGTDYQQNVILPQLLEMMKIQKGQKIIDIGCGQGYLCRHLAQLGAEITGVDASPKLIDLARKHPKHLSTIRYIVSDAVFIQEVPKDYFDAATCILSLQNMESLGQVIREMARVIKSGGYIYLVLNHPSFRIPRQSGWGYDEKRKLQYRRIDSYLSEQKIPIQMHPGAKPNEYTWSFHRPLQSYFEALHKNGLAVEQLTEWSSHRKSLPGKSQKTEDRARDEIPLFLALAAVKL